MRRYGTRLGVAGARLVHEVALPLRPLTQLRWRCLCARCLRGGGGTLAPVARVAAAVAWCVRKAAVECLVYPSGIVVPGLGALPAADNRPSARGGSRAYLHGTLEHLEEAEDLMRRQRGDGALAPVAPNCV